MTSPTTFQPPQRSASSLWATANYLLVFCVAYVALFLCMSRDLNYYDEGLELTGAMRVMDGQVIHRDFHAVYGPGQTTMDAVVFKLFGETLLVERLLDILIKSLLIVCIYAILRKYYSARAGVAGAVLIFFWFVGMNILTGSPVLSTSLLEIASSVLIFQVLTQDVSIAALCGAGALAGVAGLFRYDMGVALLAIHGCFFLIGSYRRASTVKEALSILRRSFLPYLAGFLVIFLPAAILFLHVSPAQPFLRDIVEYNARYYRRSRSLPFPKVHWADFDNLACYLPMAVALLSLGVSLWPLLSSRRKDKHDTSTPAENTTVLALIVALGIVTFVMYFKGIVRVSPGHMFASSIPSVVVIILMVGYRGHYSRMTRYAVFLLAALSAATPIWSGVHEIRRQRSHVLMVARAHFWAPAKLDDVETSWCQLDTPATKGICFLPDDDRIQAVEFIRAHTVPGQKIFVGNTKHDKILENDNFIYFASGRLPATQWSHFDPHFQDSSPVQAEMISEFDKASAPYVVLDSEYDDIHESNDSSRSTGVTLLDDYLQTRYEKVEKFGHFTVLHRRSGMK